MKIGIEYIAANALVELYENLQTRYISLEDLRKYGIEIKKVLQSNKIEAIILLSNYDLINFAHNYSNLFEIKEDKIYMKETTTCEMIRDQIISYMRMDVLIAMLSEKSLEVLGITR